MTFISIWEGWTKQCFFISHIGDRSCAIGFLAGQVSAPWCILQPDIERRMLAVAQLIHRRYLAHNPKWQDVYPTNTNGAAWVIVHANDGLRLTPETFRALDRECVEEEAALKHVVAVVRYSLKPISEKAPVSEMLAEELVLV